MAKYKVVTHMRIDSEEAEMHELEIDAMKEKAHNEFLQPENMYTIEKIESTEDEAEQQRIIKDYYEEHLHDKE